MASTLEIHDVDVQDRMTKVGLNFGYLKDVTYTAKPRPGENEIGIRAIRKNEEYYLNQIKNMGKILFKIKYLYKIIIELSWTMIKKLIKLKRQKII